MLRNSKYSASRVIALVSQTCPLPFKRPLAYKKLTQPSTYPTSSQPLNCWSCIRPLQNVPLTELTTSALSSSHGLSVSI